MRTGIKKNLIKSNLGHPPHEKTCNLLQDFFIHYINKLILYFPINRIFNNVRRTNAMTFGNSKPRIEKTDRTTVGLYYICGFLAATILIIDLSIPLGVAGGVPYIAVVLFSLKSPQNRFTILVSVICSILTIVGFVASPEGGEMWKVVFNRALALFAIWVTASLALIQRTRDRKLVKEQLKALQTAKELEVQEERLKILRATMRTVNDIVGNFLNKLQLFQMEAEEKNALLPESLELMDSIIQDTAKRLRMLGDLETIQEKPMCGNIGIDYEQSNNV